MEELIFPGLVPGCGKTECARRDGAFEDGFPTFDDFNFQGVGSIWATDFPGLHGGGFDLARDDDTLVGDGSVFVDFAEEDDAIRADEPHLACGGAPGCEESQ